MLTAVVLALLSASSFATSTVVQHRAATDVGDQHGAGGAFRLFLQLLKTPAWLAGQAAAVTGFVLHAFALRFGPVVVVQPLLSGGLVFTLALGALVDRRHPGRPLPSRRQWIAAGIVVVGLTVFLLSSQPRHGHVRGRALVLLLAGGGALLMAVGAAWWRRRPEARHKALVLGVAAGCGFGITGVLLKQVVRRVPNDWHGVWPVLLMIAVGVTSIVLAQSAYQSGALIESLPSLTVLEPIVAIAVASRAYGEHLHPGWGHHLLQGLGLLLLAVGVFGIARTETNKQAMVSEEPGPVEV